MGTVERAIARSVRAAFAAPAHVFDWAKDCPDAVGRAFPPVVGAGRGHVLEPYVCIRCGRESWLPFTRAHRPVGSDVRTCGGTVVRRSEVEQARTEETKKATAAMIAVARAESGWRV